jgi:hypothetical protein
MVCVPFHSLNPILRIESFVASARVMGAGSESALTFFACPFPGSIDHMLRENYSDSPPPLIY